MEPFKTALPAHISRGNQTNKDDDANFAAEATRGRARPNLKDGVLKNAVIKPVGYKHIPAVQALDGSLPRTPRTGQCAVRFGPRKLGGGGPAGAAESSHQLAATVTVGADTSSLEFEPLTRRSGAFM